MVSISNQAWDIAKVALVEAKHGSTSLLAFWAILATPFELCADCGSVQGDLGIGPTMAIATATYICGLAFAWAGCRSYCC